jgi:hypothetical protein
MTNEIYCTVSSIIVIVLIGDKVGSTGGSSFKVLMASLDARIENIYCDSLAVWIDGHFLER